jgi:TetR/AcrR family transcriptional repressor of nem operon
MARPREFDIDEATQKALEVFWSKGYENASLPDLLDGMEIARGSFYKAYDSKKSLFMKVLEIYDQEAVMPAVAILSDAEVPDGWRRIMSFFQLILSGVKNGDSRGCLVCTTAAGPALHDPEIARAIHSALDKMRGGFEVALNASAQHTNLTQTERTDLSNTLTMQYVGLRVLARSQAPFSTLKQSIAGLTALNTLPS